MNEGKLRSGRLLRRTPLPALLSVGIAAVCIAACSTDDETRSGSGGSASIAQGGKASSVAGADSQTGGKPSAGGAPNGGFLGSGASANSGEAGESSRGGATAQAGASSGGATAPTGGSGGGTSGGSSAAPSCATSGPGRTNCGVNNDESCCASLPVDGGTYSRTYRNTGSGASGKADSATISTFHLDKYEVTVARFREYVKYLENGGSPPEAGSGKHAHLNEGKGVADSAKSGAFEPGWNASWNNKIPSGAGATAKWKTLLTSKGSSTDGGCHIYGTWTNEPGKNELSPITCTSWYESYAFCIWDGGFLPTEAEWKYAAAGGAEHRAYPWGNVAPGSNNEYAIYDCCYPNKQCSGAAGRDTCTGVINAAPVGYATKGVGRYGQMDLIGNVWEWLLDRYNGSYVNPCKDCAYMSGNTSNRVMPGSGFHTGADLGSTLMYSWNRASVSFNADSYRGDYAVGVRCARAPSP